jgi:hypothetical protein
MNLLDRIKEIYRDSLKEDISKPSTFSGGRFQVSRNMIDRIRNVYQEKNRNDLKQFLGTTSNFAGGDIQSKVKNIMEEQNKNARNQFLGNSSVFGGDLKERIKQIYENQNSTALKEFLGPSSVISGGGPIQERMKEVYQGQINEEYAPQANYTPSIGGKMTKKQKQKMLEKFIEFEDKGLRPSSVYSGSAQDKISSQLERLIKQVDGGDLRTDMIARSRLQILGSGLGGGRIKKRKSKLSAEELAERLEEERDQLKENLYNTRDKIYKLQRLQDDEREQLKADKLAFERERQELAKAKDEYAELLGRPFSGSFRARHPSIYSGSRTRSVISE